MQSIQPLLKSVGWKAETVEDWSKRSQEGKINMLNLFGMLTSSSSENTSMRYQASLRVRLAWGRRRSGPNAPAPPLPSPVVSAHATDGEENISSSEIPYPFYYIFDSKEVAMEQAALRNRDMAGVELPPLPSVS